MFSDKIFHSVLRREREVINVKLKAVFAFTNITF